MNLISKIIGISGGHGADGDGGAVLVCPGYSYGNSLHSC